MMPISRSSHTGSSASHFCRAWLVFGLLAVGGLLTVGLAHAQRSAIQQVSLSQGWNFVSLYVKPGEASLDSIFAGHLDQVYRVEDESGRAYVPGEGTRQLTTWQEEENYLVYAKEAVDIEVAGTLLSPESIPLALDQGWNQIPYLLPTPQAAGEALASIADCLVLAKDGKGNVYSPNYSISALDTLRPGQGYRVYVDQPDTLLYSGEGKVQGDTIVVNALADALSLEGVEVGRHIRVRGYREPGDGGGGLFVVDESSCATDGGTCFVFEEDVSTEQAARITDNWIDGVSLPHTDLVWGTVRLQYGPSPSQYIDERHLHGHTNSAKGNYNWINLKNGIVNDGGGNPIRSARENAGADEIMMRYKYATTARRLRRKKVTDAVNIDWWGAIEADPNDPKDQTWRIAWAINKAAEIYDEGNYDWAYVDIPGEYYYLRMLNIQNGVKIRGAGSHHQNGVTRGTLKIMPEKALDYIADDWNPEPLEWLNQHRQFITHEYLVNKFGIESLRLDGNFANNNQFLEKDYPHWQRTLQNSGSYNAFFSTGANAMSFAEGAAAHFNDVVIEDYGGNGIAVNPKSGNVTKVLDFSPSSNVVVRDPLRNHAFYRVSPAGGDPVDGLTAEGASWAVFFKLHRGNYTNMTVKNVRPNPLRSLTRDGNLKWQEVVNHHGKAQYRLDYKTESDKIEFFKMNLDGFNFDLSGGNHQHVSIFNMRGYGGVFKNGTIKSLPDNRIILFRAASVSGGSKPWIQDYTIRDVTIVDEGGGVQLTSGYDSYHTRNVLRDIKIQPAHGINEPTKHRLLSLELGGASESPQPGRLDVQNITDGRERSNLFQFNHVPENPTPYHVFVDSLRTNQNGNIWTELGVLPESERETNRKYGRIFLSNSTVNTNGSLLNNHKAIIQGYRPVRLRNCRDNAGRVSDASGTLTTNAGDEGNNYVLVPTSLMSRPLDRSATLVDSPSGVSITKVEVANSDGTLRSADLSSTPDQRDPYLKIYLSRRLSGGETVTINWTARVTPLSEYRTTGLFTSRFVADRSYTLSSGTQEVDLRGVAASQESKAPIRYTATSDNEGVATVSVGDDGYTLTISPQAIGTTTVTVTGSIDGIGSATNTFGITVE